VCLNPLPIGSWFPTPMPANGHTSIGTVSIPFLSGHGFLRSILKEIPTAEDYFVSIPFLSGHGFLRLRVSPDRKAGSASQSPSYRVMVSYQGSWPWRLLYVLCLNPLPIGSWFPTSVPDPGPIPGLGVSIPFLSGHGFLQTIALTVVLLALSSQSPSYRVMVSYRNGHQSGGEGSPCLNPLPIGSWFPTGA